MSKKIVPLGDLVLLRLAEPQKQVGRILIPDVAVKKPQRGEVLAVGPDCKSETEIDLSSSEAKRVKVGQVVLFNLYAGTVAPDDDRLLLIREDELLAVIE